MPFALPQDASASASAASAQANPPRPIEWSPAPEFRSRHYRILSDLAPEDTRLYAAHLDIIYEEYARRLASLAQRAPEVPFVLMFAKERDYLRVLRDRYAINATGSGGMFFISPGGAALAFFTESLPRSRSAAPSAEENLLNAGNILLAGTSLVAGNVPGSQMVVVVASAGAVVVVDASVTKVVSTMTGLPSESSMGAVVGPPVQGGGAMEVAG